MTVNPEVGGQLLDLKSKLLLCTACQLSINQRKHALGLQPAHVSKRSSVNLALQIERMTLEAEHVQDPSVAPIDHQPASQTPPVWRGLPVQMQLPPHTGPVKVHPKP